MAAGPQVLVLHAVVAGQQDERLAEPRGLALAVEAAVVAQLVEHASEPARRVAVAAPRAVAVRTEFVPRAVRDREVLDQVLRSGCAAPVESSITSGFTPLGRVKLDVLGSANSARACAWPM